MLSKIENYEGNTKITTENLSYYDEKAFLPFRGSLKSCTKIYHTELTLRDYSVNNVITYGLLPQDESIYFVQEEVTGFDGLKDISLKYKSKLNDCIVSTVDSRQGLVEFSYDKLGRTVSEIRSPKTIYEETKFRRVFNHIVDDNKRTHSVNVTDYDNFYNMTRTYFDGMGNKTKVFFNERK